jgi:TatD DNase family protein
MDDKNSKFVDIHTHNSIVEDSKFIRIYNIQLDEHFDLSTKDNLSIGLHPWNLDKINNIELCFKKITELSKTSSVLAIGECGIDRKISVELSVQENIFVRHIEISEMFEKPLIIHCVRAFDRILKYHKEIHPSQPWIVHGFSSNKGIANELINNEIRLSFGHRVLNAPDEKLAYIKELRSDDFFLETDEKDVQMLIELYNKIAILREENLEVLKNNQLNNFAKTFEANR